MDTNPIAKSWNRLLEVVGSLRRASRAAERHAEDFVPRTPVWDDRYDEPRVKPYSPESQRIRAESSLHLGC